MADPHNTVTALLLGTERGFGLLATQAASPYNCDDVVDALAATLNEYRFLRHCLFVEQVQGSYLSENSSLKI